jgi:hypothetical protein
MQTTTVNVSVNNAGVVELAASNPYRLGLTVYNPGPIPLEIYFGVSAVPGAVIDAEGYLILNQGDTTDTISGQLTEAGPQDIAVSTTTY